ncbi:MAG: cysteine desulfurase family protein [Rhizobiaceae bacterium]
MASERAYLDFNASAPLLSEARAAMVDALSAANPSSVHAEGRAARRVVEEARSSIAALVNGRTGHVVFTSGATEAASTLLTPEWRLGRSRLAVSRLYVTAADHPCMLSGGRFQPDRVTHLGVGGDGVVDLAALRRVLSDHVRSEGLPLVGVHAANNETGVVQPVAAVAELVKEAGGILVVDAVQAAGRLPIDMADGYADFVILSAHKLGGPKGMGAIVGAGDLMMPSPLVTGGGQERGHRSGTENVAAITGFGAAARVAADDLARMGDVSARRAVIERAIHDLAPDAEVFGADVQRLPNTTFFAIPGIKAETMQIAFDLAGVAVSAGSACSSGRVGPSHVLKAMGRGDDASALRVSIGASTTDADVERFRAALAGIAGRRGARNRAA